MDFIRTAANPWGEEVLLGLAWSVLYLVVVAGGGTARTIAFDKRTGETRWKAGEGKAGEGGGG